MKKLMVQRLPALKAQGMVEFALVLPLLLVVLWGTIEAGRLLFIYSATASASREAARYGAAVGESGSSERYRDCDAMIAAARRIGSIAGIAASDVVIRYDDGNGNDLGGCPSGGTGPQITDLAPRVVVTTRAHFETIVPLVPFAREFDLESSAARTIIKNIPIGGRGSSFGALQYGARLSSSASDVYEDPASSQHCSSVQVVLSTAITTTVTAQVTVSGAVGDAEVHLGGPAGPIQSSPFDVNFPAGSGAGSSVPLSICAIDDMEYDPGETLVVRLNAVSPGSVLSPDVHRAAIWDNESPLIAYEALPSDVPEGNSGSTTIPVLVKVLTPDGTGPLTNHPYIEVNCTLNAGGTATQGEDFTLTGTTLAFPDGTSEGVCMLDLIGDTTFEDNETIGLGLAVASGIAEVDPARGVQNFLILDDDNPPQVYFTLAEQTARDDPNTDLYVSVDVRLAQKSGKEVNVTIQRDVASTAIFGTDYTYSPDPIHLTFTPGQLTQSFNLIIKHDNIDEQDEEILLNLASMDGNATVSTPSQHRILITNKVVNFTTAETVWTESPEGKRFTIEAVLNNPATREIRVNVSVESVATRGSDYVVTGVDSGPVLLVFPAGATSRVFTVELMDDLIDEDDELIFFTLSDPVGVAIGTTSLHTVRMVDNEPMPKVKFLPASQTIDEGASGEVTVQLYDPATGANTVSGRYVTVPYTVSGTATTADYTTSPSGQVAIPTGSGSAKIVVAGSIDWLVESPETARLVMGAVHNAEKGTAGVEDTHVVTINDKTVPPRVAFTTASQTPQEDIAAPLVITIQLLHPTNNVPVQIDIPVVVPVTISGDATFGVDYKVSAGGTNVTGKSFSVTIPAGVSFASINVPLIDDTDYEGEETALFTLGTPDNAVLAAIPYAIEHAIRIQDNDTPDCNQIYSMRDPVVSSSDMKITVPIQNNNRNAAVIDSLVISWTNQNSARLSQIIFNGVVIWSGSPTKGPVMVNSNTWPVLEADRTIQPGEEKQLVFVFDSTQVTDWQAIMVTMKDELLTYCPVSPPR